MHLFFRRLSDELNAGGYTVKVVLQEKTDLDWTPELVKEILWKTIQRWITEKDSTKELQKAGEIDLIYETLNRHLGEKFGLHVPFPHYESEEEFTKSTT